MISAGFIPRVRAVLTWAMHCVWHAFRLPLVTVLSLLEPLVRAVLSIAMVLGIFTAIVFEISSIGSRFLFLEMLALSLGFGLLLLAYHGLLYLTSR